MCEAVSIAVSIVVSVAVAVSVSATSVQALCSSWQPFVVVFTAASQHIKIACDRVQRRYTEQSRETDRDRKRDRGSESQKNVKR